MGSQSVDHWWVKISAKSEQKKSFVCFLTKVIWINLKSKCTYMCTCTCINCTVVKPVPVCLEIKSIFHDTWEFYLHQLLFSSNDYNFFQLFTKIAASILHHHSLFSFFFATNTTSFDAHQLFRPILHTNDDKISRYQQLRGILLALFGFFYSL